jgi:hypothetical protein
MDDLFAGWVVTQPPKKKGEEYMTLLSRKRLLQQIVQKRNQPQKDRGEKYFLVGSKFFCEKSYLTKSSWSFQTPSHACVNVFEKKIITNKSEHLP